MSSKILPEDLDFEMERSVAPLHRAYPIVNPPPDNEVEPGAKWPEAMKVELDFFIDRNVDIHNRRAMAYAIRAQAWRRLTNYQFLDDPRTLAYRYYHIRFIFATQTHSVWWMHIFVLRMMTEMAQIGEDVEIALPFDSPFYRINLCS